MDWKETTYEEYLKIYEKHLETITNFEHKAHDKELEPHHTIDIRDDIKTYTFKFVVIHM